MYYVIRKPVIRKSVSRENLAILVKNRKANEFQQKLFLRCLQPIIFNNLKKSYLDQSLRDEIANDLIAHIIKVLDSYDSKKSKFITWAWTVIRNMTILNSKRETRYQKTFLLFNQNKSNKDQDYEIQIKDIKSVRDHVTCIEIRNTIKTLLSNYPSKKNLIYALLGDPDGYLNDRINFSDISKKYDIPTYVISKFYNDVVYPVFENKFPHYKLMENKHG